MIALRFFAFFTALSLHLNADLSALTLKDAVELGRAQSPTIAESRQKLDEARANRFKAWSAVTPTLSSSIGYSRQADALTSSRPRFDGQSYHYYSLTATLSQPILYRGAINAVLAARMGSDLGEIAYEIADRDLSLNVVQTFYSVLLKKREVETLKKSKTLRTESLQIAERRSKIGRAQRLDVLQIQTQIALLEPKIQKAENELSTVAAQLAILIGEHERKSVSVEGDLEIPNPRIILEKLKAAQSTAPELRKKALEIESTEYKNTVAMTDYWPKLSGEGTWSRSGFKKGDLTDEDAAQWSLGVKLSIPLFQGGRGWFDNQILNSQVLQLRSQQRQLLDQWSQEQITARDELETAGSMIESGTRAFKLAEQSVKVAKEDYKVANIDYLQLLNTQQDLLDAELALNQAKYDFISKLTKYTKVYGVRSDLLFEQLSASR